MYYAIACSLNDAASYFLFTDFMDKEKKFSYEKGQIYHKKQVEFTENEITFINEYFNKLNG